MFYLHYISICIVSQTCFVVNIETKFFRPVEEEFDSLKSGTLAQGCIVLRGKEFRWGFSSGKRIATWTDMPGYISPFCRNRLGDKVSV